MPRYSSASQAKLDTCHPDLQTLGGVLIKKIDHTVVCGHRGPTEQNEAYRTGKSTVQWPDSKHNHEPSMAFDIAPYFAEIGNIDWEDIKAFYLLAGRVLEIADRLYEEGKMTHRVRCGADWDSDGRTRDQRFDDAGHFELIQAR